MASRSDLLGGEHEVGYPRRVGNVRFATHGRIRDSVYIDIVIFRDPLEHQLWDDVLGNEWGIAMLAPDRGRRHQRPANRQGAIAVPQQRHFAAEVSRSVRHRLAAHNACHFHVISGKLVVTS